MKDISNDEKIQRGHDAKELLNHYLIKEFFRDIDRICYDSIVNTKHESGQERDNFYYFAKSSKLLKAIFEQTITAGTFKKEPAIKKIRNIHI